MEAFNTWMWDNYNMRCTGPELDPSEMLFEIMKSVRDSDPEFETIKDLNNIALNTLQDIYVKKYKLQKISGGPSSSSSSPSSTNPSLSLSSAPLASSTDRLDRDTNLYGVRPVTTGSTMLVPQSSKFSQDEFMVDVNAQYDRMKSDRSSATNANANQNVPLKPIVEIESAIPSDLFNKMVEEKKASYLESSILLQKPLIPDNPKALYEQLAADQAPDAEKERERESDVNDVIDSIFNARGSLLPYSETTSAMQNTTTTQAAILIETPKQRMISLRYITINGFDRNWTLSPLRCQFNLDFSDLTTNYRNVASVKATRLVVPNEIVEHRGLLQMPRYQMGGGQESGSRLSLPYLSLSIDEISDVYDGFNNMTQNQFTQFVYDTSYRCPNGRGYVVLKPAQEEVKVFYPQNLSSISRLTFSIRRPNGTLFNDHKDNFQIFKVEYEQYNTFYIKIVLDKYFDKNEFFVGDTVTMQNYTMYKPATAPACLDSTEFVKMAAFVNRSEGHEVAQLGEANENGFYQSFYVFAPGFFDQNVGKLVVDRCMVDALREYNIGVPPSLSSSGGSLINLSLQNTISLTLGLDVADRMIIQTKTI
jgi:hypothetical protein